MMMWVDDYSWELLLTEIELSKDLTQTTGIWCFSDGMQVYGETVEPIVPIIFQRTKATCFAYGQTGELTRILSIIDEFIHR